MVCKDGKNPNRLTDNKGRGAGWSKGYSFVIGHTTSTEDSVVYWPEEGKGHGVYEEAVELAEIKNWRKRLKL